MKEVEFGSLFEFIRNGMNIQQDKSGRGLPITRIETIWNGAVDPERVGFADLREEDCKQWLLKPGDLLFSHINSVEHIGKCALYEGRPSQLIHGMNLLCLRSNDSKLVPAYARWLIRDHSFKSRLANFVNKAVNQASVSIGNLKTIPVEVPSLDEQRRIAAILDKADCLRQKRLAALRKLDSLTQALFLNMFGDPASNPRRWNSLPLEDVASKITDGEHQNPTFSDEGMPIIMAGNVLADGVDIASAKRVDIV